jgi:hypothetical protein
MVVCFVHCESLHRTARASQREPVSCQLQAGETRQEQVGKTAISATSLPADYTLKGNLVDANAVIQGVPPVRSSNATIELIPSSSGAEISFTEPTEEAKSYRDDSGAFGQHLYCVNFCGVSVEFASELF